MKNLKIISFRAVQTAITAFFAFSIFNFIVMAIRYGQFDYDIKWVINATVLTTVLVIAIIWLERISLKKKNDFAPEITLGTLVGLGLTISSGVDSWPSFVEDYLLVAALCGTFFIAWGYSTVYRSIFFALAFILTCGIFYFLEFWFNLPLLIERLCEGFVIFAIAILLGRFFRFMFKNDHEFLKE